MIAEDLRLAAGTNMAETYFQLGLAAPESGTWEDEGFTACLGGFEHPICNFALRLRLDPWSARRLQALAVARPAFHVYHLPDDEPSYIKELLARFDFQQIYALELMVADEEPSEMQPLEMRIAGDLGAKRAVTTFMTNQFFGRQAPDFRRQVQEVTTGASQLEFHYLEERGKTVAAVMLSRSPGVLGVYNLCVASNRRSRGLGSSIVRWCRTIALKEGRVATLQCDLGLTPWYAEIGFRPLGRIGVFSLLKPQRLDIIEAGSELQRA